MFPRYKPTRMVDVIYKTTSVQLEKLGIRIVLTDLDNILIAWNNPDGTEELKAWLLEMKNAGITVPVASNNKDSRIRRVVEKFNLDYIVCVLKPTVCGSKLAEEKSSLKPSKMLVVGDQIMTDTWGADTVGIYNVLVQPVADIDGWNTRTNWLFKRKIMKYLSKKYPEMTWRGGLK